jgi:hypothetical protein
MRRLAILLLAAAIFPVTAAAQTPDVPLDLAKALLAGGGSPWDETQWVEIIVGGPPRQWKIEPLKGLRIMGSAAFAHTATVVYGVEGDLRAAEKAAVAQFEAAGWTLPPPPQRPSYMESGFVTTGNVASDGPRRPLCKGDRGAMINPLEMPSGPRVLRVVYMGSFSSSMCNPPTPPPRAMRDPWQDTPMPRLEPPAGARILSTGRGGGGESFSSDAFAFTSMTVEKLLAHYGEQMSAKGWQLSGPAAVQKTAAAQSWQMKHNGADWNATLVVTVVGDDMRNLHVKTLNVTEVSKRRGF